MRSTRILIIEDNVVTLGDLEMRLGQIGYSNLQTAVTGEEAIERAREFHPDLILSDINLGEGITGIEAVKQIRSEQNVPVVYLTAYDDDKTLKEAGVTEPFAYLVKPLHERELQIALSIALYKHNIEKELKTAVATKDRFISILGHDLKNSFQAIVGLSSYLIDKSSDTDDFESVVSSIHQSSVSTFKMLKNLLEWSNSQRDNISFAPVKAAAHKLFAEAIAVVSGAADAKQITITMDVPDDLTAEVDEEMVKTIIRNLLGNAVKFTPECGQITATACTRGDKLLLQIADNGVGMKKDTVDNLFLIDQAISRKGTNGETGTGFGLLLCKDFVEKHSGSISVESEPGKGSTFTVTLPLKQ